ncbi:hypothetical protein [Marinobacter fonticola]|uniref:hypothetical protein n=1 Tax=Marinobacter fonticola TaxID=2603215 RepID=UPI0011E6294F|nr:hypothetical protein [Marinobacter fonticola]
MNSLLSNEMLTVVLGVTSFTGMVVGLVAGVIILTVGFRKVVEVEKLVAPNGSEIDKMARLVGDHFVGRMIRSIALTSFLMHREFPGWGVERAAKWGNVEAEVPSRLRKWVLFPQCLFIVCGLLFFLCAGLAKWLDTGA